MSPGQMHTVNSKRDKRTGRFLKGNRPHNKGQKAKSPHKGFEKGNIPNNILYNGAVRLRKKKTSSGKTRHYLYMRTARNIWRPLHRLRYEEAYGEIPKGMVLRCVDGNTQNTEPGNWRAVSRAEQMALNRNREKQADSLRQTWAREKLRKKYGLLPLSGYHKRV